MLAKEEKRLSTLRLMQAALKDRDIAARSGDNRDGIGDDAIIAMLQGMIKQRRDAITLYQQGGRPELAAAETAEINVIKEFLPASLDGADLEKEIRAIIAALQATNIKDMGKVMNNLKEKFPGKIETATAAAMVKNLLA